MLPQKISQLAFTAIAGNDILNPSVYFVLIRRGAVRDVYHRRFHRQNGHGHNYGGALIAIGKNMAIRKMIREVTHLIKNI